MSTDQSSQSTEARQGELVLRLTARTEGSTIIAHATLTNESNAPWHYTKFAEPPILVRARGAAGQDVYHFDPGIHPHFARRMQLEAGSRLEQDVQFNAHGEVYVWAYLSRADRFKTDELRFDLP